MRRKHRVKPIFIENRRSDVDLLLFGLFTYIVYSYIWEKYSRRLFSASILIKSMRFLPFYM